MSDAARRSSPRMQVKFEAMASLSFGPNRIEGRIVDLSFEGMGVLARIPPDESEPFCRIDIHLPGLPQQAEMEGRVCHVRPDGQGHHLIGIQFVEAIAADILIHYDMLMGQSGE